LTPQQLQELRQQLPTFAEQAPLSPLLQEFCRYYGIDFETHKPHVTHGVGTVASRHDTLAVHLWQQPTATSNLLLVHGYFDHTGLFGKLIEYGLSRNCNVLIFDLPGHGLSTGEAAAIDDFGAYGRAIADVLSKVALSDLPLWVMGQSAGCAALVEYARNYPWPFAGAVLLAPLVRPVSWTKVRVGHMLLQHFTDSMPREFRKNSSDQEFLEFIRRDPLQSPRISLRWVKALRRWLASLPQEDLGAGPALVLQGDADGTVDWRYNMTVIEKLFPGSKIEYLPGAGHHLANESSPQRERYLAVVDAYLESRGLWAGQGLTDSSLLT
jgi:alpha-beta hydrolase superfamily lysophospholipase